MITQHCFVVFYLIIMSVATRSDPQAWGMSEGLTTLHHKNMLQIVKKKPRAWRAIKQTVVIIAAVISYTRNFIQHSLARLTPCEQNYWGLSVWILM
jgi:hypothetical protein